MPNGVKYSTTTPSGSLRRGNVVLGVNGNLGPTSTTGFYSMPAPQSGKYIINKVSVSGIPNFFAPQNDAELIRLARAEGAVGADTGSAAAVLAWMATQDNLEAVNFEYENIVTDGLVLNVDAGFVASYPTTGTPWYDLSGNTNNGTLINGPTFNSANSGSIVFDGVDDYVIIDVNSFIRNNVAYTFNSFFYYTGGSGGGAPYNIITTPNTDNEGDGFWQHLKLGSQWFWRTEDNISGEYGGTVITPNPFSDNTFYYLTSVVKTDTVLFYLNGVLQSTINTSFQWSRLRNDRTANLFLGMGYDTRYPMSGRINIFSLYNRELSATEILQNYNAQKGRFGL